MALQISFIRDRSKQRDPDENHAWGEFSVSSLHFYIIWFWYSFYFTFYSILKPSFFFGHHPASGLAPDPLSSFFCIPALRELQGYHRAHLAQQPHCLWSPLFPLQQLVDSPGPPEKTVWWASDQVPQDVMDHVPLPRHPTGLSASAGDGQGGLHREQRGDESKRGEYRVDNLRQKRTWSVQRPVEIPHDSDQEMKGGQR